MMPRLRVSQSASCGSDLGLHGFRVGSGAIAPLRSVGQWRIHSSPTTKGRRGGRRAGPEGSIPAYIRHGQSSLSGSLGMMWDPD